MKIKLLFIVSLIMLSGFKFHVKPVNQWVVDKGCSLKVSGKTNINKFDCSINGYAGTDTLSYRLMDGGAVKLSGSLTLYVADFDCRDKLMTQDLRKSLQQKKYPKMIITFIRLNKYPNFEGNTERLTGLVSIELAGISKQFEVNYTFSSNGDSTAKLVGRQKVYFSDFNIVPPKKLNGLIRAGNELQVEFQLGLRII